MGDTVAHAFAFTATVKSLFANILFGWPGAPNEDIHSKSERSVLALKTGPFR